MKKISIKGIIIKNRGFTLLYQVYKDPLIKKNPDLPLG